MDAHAVGEGHGLDHRGGQRRQYAPNCRERFRRLRRRFDERLRVHVFDCDTRPRQTIVLESRGKVAVLLPVSARCLPLVPSRHPYVAVLRMEPPAEKLPSLYRTKNEGGNCGVAAYMSGGPHCHVADLQPMYGRRSPRGLGPSGRATDFAMARRGSGCQDKGPRGEPRRLTKMLATRRMGISVPPLPSARRTPTPNKPAWASAAC